MISGICIWFIGAVRSDMDDHIESNKLKTTGIYAWGNEGKECITLRKTPYRRH